METIREREPSLLRSVTAQGVNAGGSPSVSPSNKNAVGNGADKIQTVSVSTPLPTDLSYQERFAKRYCDPLFPQKAVSYATLKRAFDLALSLTALLVFAPFMVVIAALIKLTSRGPIIFKQVRVGQGGRYFWCYKFRSMCADAEAQKEMLMHLNEATGPVFKIKRDPRVTPIGAFIRKTSLDELPQLINVIKGDMSIVGPRPPLPSEVAHYSAYERGRLAVRPGLTCLWQVSGRSNVSFERWVELDLLYIETMSFGNDIKIVCKTVPAVLTGSGAH
jgi:exopolysaccharide biosynthesis polyprenyl glycosylphosphotransferase